MDDIDMLLSMVENPTRRRILEAIVREPHYPLQLSKELGISQQAVMKNLSLMEQNGLVVSYRETSKIGPMRTLYVPNTEFTLLIDMHNCMFTTRLISSGKPDEDEAEVDGSEQALERLREIDSELDEMDRKRAELLRERNAVVSWLTGKIQETEDYEERKVLYSKLEGMTRRADPSDTMEKEV